jgi:glycosyltransferase involved in cell wall biosynthesis
LSADTLVVLPTYNEAGNLARLVEELRFVQPALDLLIVDDASPDGTGRIADSLARAHAQVEVVHRPGKLGLGSAHVRGMRRADERGYRSVLTMDCDFTHLPADVPRLLRALDDGADVAVGSRYVDRSSMEDWPLHRRIVTRAAHACTRGLLGLPGDATSGFRAYRVEALRRVPYASVRGDGYSFIFELLFVCRRAGLRVEQVAVRTPIRQAGQSKISRVEIARAVATLLRLWRSRAR